MIRKPERDTGLSLFRCKIVSAGSLDRNMHSANIKSINFFQGNLKIPLFALPTSLLGVSQVLNKQLLVTKISRALCNINKPLVEREGMRSRIHKYKLDYAKV
jgi:hypothetical protein